MKTLILVFCLGILSYGCSTDSHKNEQLFEGAVDSAFANSEKLADNAPADKPQSLSGDEIQSMEKELEPIIAAARKTLPDAKRQFLKGLNKGEAFFLTVNLREGKNMERVFVRITKWKGTSITGNIANNIEVLINYKNGQEINFEEDEVLDWTITKADGSEEGNYVGKYIDGTRTM